MDQDTNQQSDFLRDFGSLTEGTEIPPEFAIWSGISAVSAILSRRVWLDMGTYIIYPNLYVVLIAGPGVMKKSTALDMACGFLRQVEPGVNMVAQTITPQGLIEALQVPGGVSEGYIVASELSTFLNQDSYKGGLGALITTLYDCPSRYVYRTKGRGEEVLNNVCLSLFGATTIDWLRTTIPADAIGGGLLSRIQFIYITKGPPPVLWTTFDQRKRAVAERIVRTLGRYRVIGGECKVTPDARAEAERDYFEFRRNSPLCSDKYLAGYASRRQIHILKLAVVLCVIETNALEIQANHIRAAVKLVEWNERGLPGLVRQITMSEKGLLAELVMGIIDSHGGTLDRAVLLRLVSHRMDARELTETLETLIRSSRVKCHANGAGIMVSSIHPTEPKTPTGG